MFLVFMGSTLTAQCNIISLVGTYASGSCGSISFQSTMSSGASLYGGCGSFQFVHTLLDNVISTNSADISIDDIAIYPNPSLGYLIIKSETTVNSISMYTLLGKNIFSLSKPFSYLNLDVSSYPSGSYILRLNLDNNKTINKQIVIIHH